MKECPQCKNPLPEDKCLIRCPRCYCLLLTKCDGNCAKCKNEKKTL